MLSQTWAYTPYSYPHPLAAGSNKVPTAPPTPTLSGTQINLEWIAVTDDGPEMTVSALEQ